MASTTTTTTTTAPTGKPTVKFIVEHLEEDLHEWCRLEYAHMIQHVGAGNLIFSHMHPHIMDELKTNPAGLAAKALCGSEPTPTDVVDLGIPVDRVCLLDMEAEEELTPADASRFDYLLFGGILGDGYQSADRTSILRAHGFPGRRLGPVQMTTDTCVIVSHMVVNGGRPLEEIPFADCPTVRFNKHEAVELPYRYVGIVDQDGKVTGPMMAPGMFEKLKRDNESDLWDLNLN
ncbi:SAM-dependent RNA methyltransferase [Blastocladiella britannica]|nr:SAM-dependent RNA methyltransferase [Blastocladiella britannica]